MAEDLVTGPAPCNASSGWLAITLYTGSPPGTEAPYTKEATTPLLDCESVAPPVVVEAWTNATVNVPGHFMIENFRFDQDITIATSPGRAYLCVSSGCMLSMPTQVHWYVRFPAPDTLQLLLRDRLYGQMSLPVGTEYHFILGEGAVKGPAPCYVPSAALNDPYLSRAVYGGVPHATDGAQIYTTPVHWDWTISSESDNPTRQPTEFTTEEIVGASHQPEMTKPPLSLSVDCSDSGMMIFIPRSMIGDALATHLHFLDPACVGNRHNATHITIATTYDGCGTFMEVRGDNVIFFNVIHDEAIPVEPGSVITRDQDIEIPVQCMMDLEGIAEISFRPDTSKITFREDGYGSFNFSLRLYHGNDYTTPYQPVDYPVHVAMGNKLYFEARTWSEPGLELFVQTCRATPTSNSDDFHRYTFIQDGCIEDSTVIFHPSYDPDVERFEIDAFAFVDTLPQPVVYVHCDMVLCNSTDASSRCAIGCPTRGMNLLPGVHRRHARSASGSRAYAITQGPISVMEDGGKEGSHMSSVQLPVLLTTVCLLVGCVLVLGTLIVVMRKGTQRLQLYSPLATEENKAQELSTSLSS
ncbi:ZP domain-containing protein-like [Patiria miniata]|uniref:ZP domain-containing protein n=1 Tax=Patiria miniata TaxID=46514 RepID=A0A914AFP8_PATMI|nr:ZP domain-containing protein-like [Patiria miniata]